MFLIFFFFFFTLLFIFSLIFFLRIKQFPFGVPSFLPILFILPTKRPPFFTCLQGFHLLASSRCHNLTTLTAAKITTNFLENKHQKPPLL